MMQSFTSSRISISPSDNPSAVLPSSTELFYFYREALERCAKLSTRQPLLDLCKVYRKWLKTYAENVLTAALIKCVSRLPLSLAGAQLTQSRVQVRPQVERGPPEHAGAAHGVPRAQHGRVLPRDGGSGTSTPSRARANQLLMCPRPQLEERLQERIHPDFRDRVSLEAEKDLFTGTASAALLAILRELEFTAEPCFASMARSPWRDAEYVSSESVYVGELTRALETVVGVVREGVEQKKYVRSACDKIVGCVALSLGLLKRESFTDRSMRVHRLVLAKFTQTIVKTRPITQTGAEQVRSPRTRLAYFRANTTTCRSCSTCKASSTASCTSSSHQATPLPSPPRMPVPTSVLPRSH